MNFYELYSKIREIDQGTEPDTGSSMTDTSQITKPIEPVSNASNGLSNVDQNGSINDSEVDEECDCSMGECGTSMPMTSPPQQDSVNVNISMNGSGVGGIRDIMDILSKIETNPANNDPAMGKKDIMIGDKFDEAGEKVMGLDAVLPRGDDMHSNRGDNRNSRMAGTMPVANPIKESLKDRLSSLYHEVKNR